MIDAKCGMNVDAARDLVARIPHWHHAFEIIPGVRTPGSYDPAFLFEKLQLPADMRGERVLDIGASDGFFTLEMSRRGADVICVDYRDKNAHGFATMEQISGRTFEYYRANIYDLTPAKLGKFDRVLCLGVLYHLPDMVRALHVLRTLTDNLAYLETHSDNQFCPNYPAARYYVDSSLAGDWTNFWSPNRLCVLDMLKDASFDPVRDEVWRDRLFVAAKANANELSRRKMSAAYGVLG